MFKVPCCWRQLLSWWSRREPRPGCCRQPYEWRFFPFCSAGSHWPLSSAAAGQLTPFSCGGCTHRISVQFFFLPVVDTQAESLYRLLFFLWWMRRQNISTDYSFFLWWMHKLNLTTYYFSCGGCASRISVQSIHFSCGGCTHRISVQITLFFLWRMHRQNISTDYNFFCGGCTDRISVQIIHFSCGGCMHRQNINADYSFFL